MKSLLIGICDSSATDTELMIQYLKIAETCLSMNFEVRTYSTGKSLLDSYCPVFDIFFLNLPIPDMDSKILLEQLRQHDAHVSIILTSETSELYPLGYEYSAKNYFVKPLSYCKILTELKRNMIDKKEITKPYIWYSDKHGEYKIYLHKLRYIETDSHQLILHYENEHLYVKGSLSDFHHKLPSNSFYRSNNSYIVNVNYIEKIKKDISRYCIFLITGEKIPLSRDKKMTLTELINGK